jgi:alkaline phosphatase
MKMQLTRQAAAKKSPGPGPRHAAENRPSSPRGGVRPHGRPAAAGARMWHGCPPGALFHHGRGRLLPCGVGGVTRPRHPLVAALCAGVVGLATGCAPSAGQPPAAPAAVPAAVPAARAAADPVRALQAEAEATGRAAWGHWGEQPEKYVGWSNHSNRLIPVYTFGMSLAGVAGPRSVYRDAERLAALYGRLPEATLDETAEHFDQTDVYRLQMAAVEAGKKYVFLVVFDGMDWTLTRTAAIAARGRVAYDSGRGTGFQFQDYRGVETDFGFCVTSPANDGTKVDVDAQAVRNPGGERPGGYDPVRGGRAPWDPGALARYLTGRDRERPHAVTDSAASATSLCTGRKTYNDAINVDVRGAHLEPLARTLQARGFGVGVVTSVPISHATPACGYANNVTRDDYQDIARDLLGEPSIAHPAPLPGLDVVVGTGHGVRGTAESDKDQGKNFEPGSKYVADSTVAAVDAARGGRYRVAVRTPGRRGDDVLAEAARDAAGRGLRLLGLFGVKEGNLPYQTADGDFDPVGCRPEQPPSADRLRKKYCPLEPYSAADLAENPTLADMTRAALEVLGGRDRFWLMVEAGDVDWAAHANDIDAAIGAVKSGDAAFQAVVKWIERRDAWKDAVVIVTSDHGHMFVLDDPAAFAVR